MANNSGSDSWNPAQYEKFKDERSRPFFDLMGMVEKKSAMRIIDLGCGTGELTAELHRGLAAEETTGLDSSSEMLKKAERLGEPALKFEKGDIENWNRDGSRRESFDLVFSNAALQWCDHHEALLARLRDAIRVNGQIALQMPMNQDYPTHIVAREMAAEISPDFKIQDSMLTLGEYATILNRLGFRRQQALIRVYGHELKSREDVIEWVKGTTLTRFKQKLSAADYESFLKDYRARLFKFLPDDRPFFYPFKRVLLWGRL